MGSLIVQDVWELMNEIIRANATVGASAEINKKMLAINQGYKYLAQRMIQKGKALQELQAAPSNLVTTISTNKVDLPSDFSRLVSLWQASSSGGSSYFQLGENQILSYAVLLENTGERFFQSTDIGLAQYAAVKEPYIYFDRYFDASGTTDVKIQYDANPATLVAYDRINLTSIVGTFVVGEIVTGSSTSETATVYAVGATYIDVYTYNRSGSFAGTETITGGTSSATGSYASMTEKPQALEVSDKYDMLVANAGALTYLYMNDEIELDAKNETLDGLINMVQVINKNTESHSFGITK